MARVERGPAPRPRRRGTGSRYLFYSHDGLGLGHVRRNLAIASAIGDMDPDASVLVATSVEEVEKLGVPPHVDILRLPGLRKLDNGRYAARRLQVSWSDVTRLRANLLAAAAESFRPAVLLVDKHPLGAGGELGPALEAARAGGARAVLGLRDILDDPVTVAREWSACSTFERIAESYDRVLIYGQPDIVDPVREYGFPSWAASMTYFCGYVLRPAWQAAWTDDGEGAFDPLRSRPLVLATAGGGEDGFALLEAFIEAAAGRPWDAMVVSGPQCSHEPMSRLRGLAAEAGVDFHRFVPDLPALFGSLDALVCMGGYNTLVEAAASGVPTVCVPRVRPRNEQLLRARAFARLGLVRVLEPDRLHTPRMREAIESARAARRANGAGRAHGSLELDGAARAAHHLVELAADGVVAGRTAAEGMVR